jgi:hypothetical protein
VLELRRGAGLAEQTSASLLGRRELGVQHLDGDAPVELPIERAVDGAHPSLAEQRLDHVPRRRPRRFARHHELALVVGRTQRLAARDHLELPLGSLVPRQASADDLEQLGVGERLRQVVVGAELHALAHVGPIGARAEEDERHPAEVRRGTDGAEHAVAVEARHPHVAHDEIGRMRQGRRDPRFAILGARRVVPLGGEQLEDVGADPLVVLDDQNSVRHHGAWCGVGSGKAGRTGCPGAGILAGESASTVGHLRRSRQAKPRRERSSRSHDDRRDHTACSANRGNCPAM